jgi:hypothetical protein
MMRDFFGVKHGACATVRAQLQCSGQRSGNVQRLSTKQSAAMQRAVCNVHHTPCKMAPAQC